jgi:dipeptidyl-peptidase-3
MNTKININMLKCDESFNLLTKKEQAYSYYLSKACWNGSIISFFQCSYESPILFLLFQRIFSNVKNKDYDNFFSINFLEYVCKFYGNFGNYYNFGYNKFYPEIDKKNFYDTIKNNLQNNNKYDGKLLVLLDSIIDIIYDDTKNIIGYPPNNQSSFYSSNITKEEIIFIQKFMDENKWSSYNTRLFKNNNQYVIKVASVHNNSIKYNNLKFTDEYNEIKAGTYIYNEKNIYVEFADFSLFLKKTCESLKKAQLFCSNKYQYDMLENYILSFEFGSIPNHINGSFNWIKDINPNIEESKNLVDYINRSIKTFPVIDLYVFKKI